MNNQQFIEDMRLSIAHVFLDNKINAQEYANLRESIIAPFDKVKMNEDTRKRTKGKITGLRII